MPLRPAFLRALALFAILAVASSAADDGSNPVTEARKALMARRYDDAMKLYSKLTQEQPAMGDAWYGLVRSELGSHRASEAYAAAEEALQKAPQSAGAQTAAGLAAWRKGDLYKAEAYYRAALKLNPDYPGALRCMAAVNRVVSKYKSARDLELKAWTQAPDDPDLMAIHANSLKGADHIAALEAMLARLDPDSDEARRLRIHIENDRANLKGNVETWRLTSPYRSTSIRMFRLWDGPSQLRGMGIRLQLNGKQTVTLLLDSGASGISISPKTAEKAGLTQIGSEAGEARGIGDEKPSAEIEYRASEIRAGDVVFSSVPVSAFRTAHSSDFEGLIGPDVFSRFIVHIDFVQVTLNLEARPDGAAEPSGDPVDSKPPAPGFHRLFRFGDHLLIPTNINGKGSALFLLDSGASTNVIDTDVARQYTATTVDPRFTITGVQGKVNKTSFADHVTLTFAGLQQEIPDLFSIDLENVSDSMGVGVGGILGMQVLQNLAVVLDYREGTVRFEYKKP